MITRISLDLERVRGRGRSNRSARAASSRSGKAGRAVAREVAAGWRVSQETGAMAATGPEGNRGQRSPPGAAFAVAILIPAPGDRAPHDAADGTPPRLLPGTSAAAGHHRRP